MSDIFLSYAREDKDRVQSFAQALEQKGWTVWWDLRIRTGQRFPEVIQKALDASKTVVVVWTKRSVESDWVMNEARRGLRRKVLFPVMLLQRVEIPLEFEHVHTAELMNWQPDQAHAGFDRFIDDLSQVIGVPSNPAVQPTPAPPRPTPESSLLPKTAGQVESVRAALGGNNNLSALTLSPGTLVPSFAASTTDYTVNVASDVTSVNVSATKADSNAVLSGNATVGSGTATGQATLPLNGPGTTTLAVITVIAPNGSSKTYRITVNRAAPSGNNNLSILSVSAGSMSPPFSANSLNYAVNVGSNVTNVTVSATKADPNAVISGDVSAGAGVVTGQAPIQLSGPGTTTGVTIWVTAPEGSQRTYTLNVCRGTLGGNNNLQSLSVAPGTLSPSFSASRTAYTVNVGDNVTSVTVTPTLQDDNSSVTINGQGANKRQSRSVVLRGPGSNTVINIVVTAPNGAQKTYAVEIYRAAEVESTPDRRDPTPASEMGGSSHPGSSRETFTSQGAMEFPQGNRESARLDEDRPSEAIGPVPSTESLPYLPIGLGILAAMGALVYFLIFLQGPSPGTRDVTQYQPASQPPTTRTEVITPPSAPIAHKLQPVGRTPITPAVPAIKDDLVTTEKGRVLFQEKGVCFPCHGKTGKGDGPAGSILNPKPTDLTNRLSLKYQTDKERFNVMKYGIPGTGMVAMDHLSDKELWLLVPYLKQLAK